MKSWQHFLLNYTGLIFTLVVLMMLGNLSLVNNVFFPIGQYLSMAGMMWDESVLGTLQFLSHKSLFALAHTDSRTGLHIWTVEFDFITLAVYAAVVGIYLYWAKEQQRFFSARSQRGAWLIVALLCLVFASTYVTSIAHCAGPTWAGFVLLYGLGFEELDQTYWPQLLFVLLAMGFYLLHKKVPR